MKDNHDKDTVQYKKYKEVLGKQMPKSFDKFQDMKYNNINKYEDLGLLYKDTKSGKVWLKSTFATEKKFKKHIDKHLKEYGDITETEYLNVARRLLASPIKGNIEGFKSELGFIFRYNSEKNDFAVGREDGKISTLYKLKNGREQWLEEINKYKKEE